jgi:hypothetical protein
MRKLILLMALLMLGTLVLTDAKEWSNEGAFIKADHASFHEWNSQSYPDIYG